MAKKGRKLSYDAYVKQYNELANKVLGAGGTIKSKRLTKREFEMAHAELVADRKEEVALGKRKTIGNLTRTIVKEQIQTLSEKQAKTIQKGLKKRGVETTLFNLRYGVSEPDWNAITERKEELEFELGMPGWQVRKIIGIEFFGSE